MLNVHDVCPPFVPAVAVEASAQAATTRTATAAPERRPPRPHSAFARLSLLSTRVSRTTSPLARSHHCEAAVHVKLPHRRIPGTAIRPPYGSAQPRGGKVPSFGGACPPNRSHPCSPPVLTYARSHAPDCAARRRDRRRPRGRARFRGSPAPGGGTTLPGKLLSKLDPGAIDRLAARLPEGAALVSATNGKTTTAAMAAEILRPALPARAQRLRREPRLRASPRRCWPRDGAELGLFEVGRGARCRRCCGACSRARSASATSSATSSTATASWSCVAERWRDGRRRSSRRRRSSSSTATIHRSARSPRRIARATVLRARRSRGFARPSLQHAADSKYCLRCGTPYDVRGRLRRPPRRLPLPACGHARPPLDVAGPRRRAARARAAPPSTSSRPRARAASSWRCPASTTSTTRLAAAALARRSRRPLDEIAAGLGRFSAAFGRFERIPVGDKRLLLLLIKNPAGANEAVRTLVDGGAAAARGHRPERRDRRRARRLVDLGRRLRAAARRARPAGRRRAARAAELALRFTLRRAATRERDRGRAGARARARPRPRADADRRRARRPADLHRDARAAADRRRARPRATYWERAA